MSNNIHIVTREIIKMHPFWLELLKSFVVPFLAAFMGAICAYFFNTKLHKKKMYIENKTKLIYFHNKILSKYLDMIKCYKSLNRKLDLLKIDNIEGIIGSKNTIKFDLDIKLDEINFLTLYNRAFIVLAQMLQDRLKEFDLYMADYEEYINAQRTQWNPIDYSIKQQLAVYLNENKTFAIEIIGLMHIILKGLDKCNLKYFNSEFDFYDSSINYLQDNLFNNDKLYIENEQNFENAWKPKKTFIHECFFLYLKLKKLLHSISIYFCLDKFFKRKGKN